MNLVKILKKINLFNVVIDIYSKIITNIMLNGEKLKLMPLRSGIRKNIYFITITQYFTDAQ